MFDIHVEMEVSRSFGPQHGSDDRLDRLDRLDRRWRVLPRVDTPRRDDADTIDAGIDDTLLRPARAFRPTCEAAGAWETKSSDWYWAWRMRRSPRW